MKLTDDMRLAVIRGFGESEASALHEWLTAYETALAAAEKRAADAEREARIGIRYERDRLRPLATDVYRLREQEAGLGDEIADCDDGNDCALHAAHDAVCDQLLAAETALADAVLDLFREDALTTPAAEGCERALGLDGKATVPQVVDRAREVVLGRDAWADGARMAAEEARRSHADVKPMIDAAYARVEGAQAAAADIAAQRDAWIDRALTAERLAHRLQCGETIEGDDVCPWEARQVFDTRAAYERGVRDAAAVAERARAEIRKAAERADDRDDPMWATGLGAQHNAAEEIRDRILALVAAGEG